MKFRFSAAGFCTLVCISCASSNSSTSGVSSKNTVGVAGNTKISLTELVENWKLGVPPEEKPTVQALQEFLPMYADFKLKVLEAKAAGYDRDSSIVSELRGYQLQFAVPYWFQQELENEMVSELVERSRFQINVSHLLISLPDNASYSDTARAYEKLIEARNKFLGGKSTWDELDRQYSSKQSGRSMGGALGWVDAGWAVKPFEDVVFSTPKGSVSMPFRTRFGYHIVYVQDKRPAVARKKFSHLFLRVAKQNDSLEIAAVLEKASGFYSMLKSGAPWDSVVAKHSEDQFSAGKGGDIDWVDYSKGFRSQFIDSVMTMKTPGEIKKPFYSSYGVHIMRLDSLDRPKSPEDQREAWKSKLKQLDRYSDSRKTVFDKIRQIGKESVPPGNYDRFQIALRVAGPDNVAEAVLPDSVKKLPLYLLNGSVYTADNFMSYMKLNHTSEVLFSNLQKFFESFKNQCIESQMIQITRTRFPEFASLSSRYENGLMVYAITEDSVWEYSKSASERLKKLYESSKESYWHGVRYVFRRYTTSSDSVAALFATRFRNPEIPLDSLKNGIKDLFMESGELTTLEDEPFNRLVGLQAGEWSPSFEFRKRTNFLFMEKILQPEPMTYEEAEFRLISDFQKIRENEWLEGLRRKYSVLLQPEKIKI